MKNWKLAFLITIAFLWLAACNRLSIENKPSSAYTSLPNSKVGLLLPTGFVPANGYPGAENEGGTANIREKEFNIPLNEFIKGYSKQKLADNNLAITDSQYLKINGLAAWLFHGYTITGEKAYSRWLLITGNDSGCVFLTGNMLKANEKELNEPIKKALLSIIYFPGRKVKPAPKIGFSFDNNTGLKPAGEKMAMLVYTDDGLLPDSARLRNTLYVSTGPIKPDPGEDMMQYSEEIMYFSSPGMGNIGIDSSREIANPNVAVYEVIGHGIDSATNQKAVIYQATTYYGNNFFMLKGIFGNGAEKMIAGFRKTAITLKKNEE